jgi:hypothetical protein
MAGDHQLAEIYSVSMTHQLHCLGVLRHVIIKYETGSKSRFAGDGHEYHVGQIPILDLYILLCELWN